MNRNTLVTPEDLVAKSQQGSPEDISTRVANLRSVSHVLGHSIKAQGDVAKSFENQPEMYAVAVRVLDGLHDAYAQTLLEMATLDLQILLGNELNVAQFLIQMASQIRSNAAMAAQQQQQQQEGGGLGQPGADVMTGAPNGDGGVIDAEYVPTETPAASGTSVAGEGSDEVTTPEKEPEETVH